MPDTDINEILPDATAIVPAEMAMIAANEIPAGKTRFALPLLTRAGSMLAAVPLFLSSKLPPVPNNPVAIDSGLTLGCVSAIFGGIVTGIAAMAICSKIIVNLERSNNLRSQDRTPLTLAVALSFLVGAFGCAALTNAIISAPK